jgi:hypothetical protein
MHDTGCHVCCKTSASVSAPGCVGLHLLLLMLQDGHYNGHWQRGHNSAYIYLPVSWCVPQCAVQSGVDMDMDMDMVMLNCCLSRSLASRVI